MNKRYLICCFCGEDLSYEGETPDEASLKKAVAHEQSRQNNPYKLEITALREAAIALCAYIDAIPDYLITWLINFPQ